MKNLDDISILKKLDKANVLGSIEQLGDQCYQAWKEVSKIPFPEKYKKVKKIVFSGMGGSALGAYVIKSLFFEKLNLPFEIINDYHLPPYVDQNTLVILASYSGTTEETLSCAKEAIAKKACLVGLTTGGELAKILKEEGAPVYIINPIYNPSNQPRLGTGYSVFGQIAMLNSIAILKIEPREIAETIDVLKKGNAHYGVAMPKRNNPAKQLAASWSHKIPIIVTAEFLTHVGRVIRNQLHESAKSFAAYHEIPELNHHLMEGLSHPEANKRILCFLFLISRFYSHSISKRMAITKDVVAKNGIKFSEFLPTSSRKLAQAFECIQFGAYVNYYVAVGYGLDPSKIPWVDYFKKQLNKKNI